MRSHSLRIYAACLATLALTAAGYGQSLTVTSQRPSAVYSTGETVEWMIESENNSQNAVIPYTLKSNGLKVITSGNIELKDGRANLSYVATEPGALLAQFTAKNAEGKETKYFGGAVVDPDKFTQLAKEPDDFDAFWQKQIEEIKKIPANPVLTQADAHKPGVQYWKIQLDTVNGSHIQGQLARPESGEKLPAMLIVQWAGVYGLNQDWATSRASQGWLTLNILAHDMPIDQDADYYKKLAAGDLKDYTRIGCESRDKTYFRRMYLSCYQAAEYLANRPDWDGKTLVVCGTSQGGMQTIITASIHPKITAGMALVPAGCDLLGPANQHEPGWPKWYFMAKNREKEQAAIYEAAGYYDAVYFASRIKVPMLIGVGLIDTTCPPIGVITAFNNLKGPKELVIMPKSDHVGRGGLQAAYVNRMNEWADMMRQGYPAPVKSGK